MKALYTTPCIAAAALLILLAAAVLLAGCASQPAAPATPAATAPATAAAPAAGRDSNTYSLSNGVTITLPAAWQQDNTLETGVRDYGRDTMNIANFYAPTVPGGAPSTYNTLHIDIDRNPGPDFEGYFNNATLAVEKTYHTETMVSLHSYPMDIAGRKGYELTFDAYQVRGYYIFSKTDNGMYIFAFRGSDREPGVTQLRDDVLDIYKTIQISP